MASTALTVEKVNNTTGVLVTAQSIDVINGNKFLNRSGKVRVRFLGNVSATDGIVTIVRQRKNSVGTLVNASSPADGLDAAGENYEFGPFDDTWNDGDGFVHITYANTCTGITVTVTEDANP